MSRKRMLLSTHGGPLFHSRIIFTFFYQFFLLVHQKITWANLRFQINNVASI